MIAKVTPTPTATPVIASQVKAATASPSAKVPVVAAAMASRMQVRPVASFNRDSPSRIRIIRLGMGTRAAMAWTATGSVGDRMAARAKATASGISGISHQISRPRPTTVKRTRPRASSRMVSPSRNRSSLGNRHPSRNRSGGRKSRKKMSGSRSTVRPVTSTIAAPSAIWTSGSAIRVMRATDPETTTASSRNRVVSISDISRYRMSVRNAPEQPRTGGR